MIKTAYITFFIVLFSSLSANSQTLVNALTLKPVNMVLNGNAVEGDKNIDRMVISHIKTKIILFQNNNMAYFAEFKYKQCGKKAILSGQTFVEFSDGKVIEGNQIKIKQRMEEGKSGWFIGLNKDDFEKQNDNDLAFKADFEYEMRFKN